MAEAKEYQRKSAIVSLADKTTTTENKDKDEKEKVELVCIILLRCFICRNLT